MAATYVHGHHDSVLDSHRQRSVGNSAAYLAPHLLPGRSVLDVGCGPGTITADIAELVAPGVVTAVDTAHHALASARELCAERGVTNVEFAVADVGHLDHAAGAFDVVHAHQVLQHVADPVAALREMRRVCAPGGVVAARDADYAAMSWYPELPELDTWRALYRRTARADGGEPDAGRRLLSWARAAAFSEIIPSTSTWCFATKETRTWWGDSWARRVTDSTFAERAVAHGHATRHDLRRIADGWRTWAEDPDGWFTIVHAEVLCSP